MVDNRLDGVLGVLRSNIGSEPVVCVHYAQYLVDDELVASVGVENRSNLNRWVYFACVLIHGYRDVG